MTKKERARFLKELEKMDVFGVPAWFVKLMGERIVHGMEKGARGDWVNCKTSFLYACALENLWSGINSKDLQIRLKQFADAANFCMMMADQTRDIIQADSIIHKGLELHHDKWITHKQHLKEHTINKGCPK